MTKDDQGQVGRTIKDRWVHTVSTLRWLTKDDQGQLGPYRSSSFLNPLGRSGTDSATHQSKQPHQILRTNLVDKWLAWYIKNVTICCELNNDKFRNLGLHCCTECVNDIFKCISWGLSGFCRGVVASDELFLGITSSWTPIPQECGLDTHH